MAKKILIVDDEENFIKIFKKKFENYDYEIISADNGRKGLEMARSEEPDLVILDIIMPELNGLQVSRTLKFDEKYEHIPIIILSVKENLPAIRASQEGNADAYISKSPDEGELEETINKLLGVKNLQQTSEQSP